MAFRDIKAVGFDLFNTLITLEPHALQESLKRLTSSLRENGVAIELDQFGQVYWEVVQEFLDRARQDGREGHNRFWISTALERLGCRVAPDDHRIAAAVEHYFSAFVQYACIIPGTTDMLGSLRGRYRIGLLSNFTHPPAAIKIIAELGLAPYFDVILISGDLGYRKPHPLVFQELIDQIGANREQIIYVGDDPEADIIGALSAGLQPIWTTYVQDHNISPAPGLLSESTEDPPAAVTRISNWTDFLSLFT